MDFGSRPDRAYYLLASAAAFGGLLSEGLEAPEPGSLGRDSRFRQLHQR